ncbi:MAG TPA: nicotinate-nucleotide diphosphorylase (carboxylating), partial [Bacteroidales bacterium]|nr:nicotinate-nucleotide diphosphorylase (carboxylating) [Bacteroidales bacterium]
MNFKDIIILALAEDVGDGDHSSMASISEFERGAMELIAKEEGIIAGIEIAENVFHIVDPKLQVCKLLQDGDEIKPGDKVLTVEGKVISMLTAERTVLNFLQRMSGIATLTHEWDSRLLGTKTKLLDTRKTTPNFRICEKWAVSIGGGTNH